MSALAKPMFHTATGVTNLVNGVSPMVNAERVTSIDVVEIPKVGNYAGNPTSRIVFTMAQDPKTGVPGEIHWDFADSATLVTEYAKIVTLISAVLV